MATFLCKTKGNANPKGKPRVYFTSHPDDFSRYFDKLCEDIFKTHDCAIYYTASMTEALDEKDMDADLGQMNLFIVPVTFRLLSQPCRAMDTDLAYAKQHNIAILPFMMESGIDAFYSAPEKFGQRQYISPYSTDTTEISYADKLKKYLEAVLISDKTAQRVRDAFDAYIFLSYRKKDRRYANQLMRLIHKNPEYRDIAIWYDEFLTPGESFKENIDKALQQSKLFTLLVTPSLLEYVDGKPNFVMGVEYPAAKSAGMNVLPAEMVETDKTQLCEEYDGIPDCVWVENESALRERLLVALDKIAKSENNNDPEHNFLIGLAYLDGIDVEVDRDRALELITSAAEAELPEAMAKMVEMYKEGVGVSLDYREAIMWKEKLLALYIRLYGEEHSLSVLTLNNLSVLYAKSGDYAKQKSSAEKAYHLYCKLYGEAHPDTITAHENLAVAYNNLGNYQKAVTLLQQVYETQCRILGEKHPNTLLALNNLADAMSCLGDHIEATQHNKKAYLLCQSVLGNEHPQTLESMSSMAQKYKNMLQYQKSADLNLHVYRVRCKVLGEEHPSTLVSLNNLAENYMYLKKHKKSLELYEQAYRSLCKTLGEEHPHTLTVLSNLSVLYLEMGKPQEALETGMKAYQIRCAKLGEDHPTTLVAMQNVAEATRRLGNYKESISLQKKILTKRRQKLGAVHAKTVTSFVNLIATYILLPFSPLVRLWKNVVGSDNTAAPNADTAASTQAENSQQATDFETSPDTNPIGNLASDQVLKYKRWMKSPWALLISLVSITCLNTALLAAITVFAADSTGARFFMGFVSLAAGFCWLISTAVLIVCSHKFVFASWLPSILCPLLIPRLYSVGLCVLTVLSLFNRKKWKNAIAEYEKL